MINAAISSLILFITIGGYFLTIKDTKTLDTDVKLPNILLLIFAVYFLSFLIKMPTIAFSIVLLAVLVSLIAFIIAFNNNQKHNWNVKTVKNILFGISILSLSHIALEFFIIMNFSL